MLGSPHFFSVLIPNYVVYFPFLLNMVEESSQFLLESLQPIIAQGCITILYSDLLAVCLIGLLQTFVEFTCRTVEGLHSSNFLRKAPECDLHL